MKKNKFIKMKKNLIILFILFSFFSSYSQEKDAPFFFNEFNISLNKTNLSDDNTEDRFGFGIGLNRLMIKQKKVNLVFGLEYNVTRQFKKNTYEGRYANATNLEYTLNNLSVPLNFRLNLGNTFKIFTEIGVFIDLIYSSQRKGTMRTYLPNSNNLNEFSIKEKANLSPINPGISGSIGLIIPIYKVESIIKIDYKLGLHELDSYKTSVLNRYYRLIIGIKI